MNIRHKTKYSIGDKVCYVSESPMYNDWYSPETCYRVFCDRSEYYDVPPKLLEITAIRLYIDSEDVVADYRVNNTWVRERFIFSKIVDAVSACDILNDNK